MIHRRRKLVRLSAEGLEKMVDNPHMRGVVLRYDPPLVTVRVDGSGRVEDFHEDFLEDAR
jgi:hypothetical protein